jgi:RNA polymerase sigma-70 factor (ECF subfamily)
MKEPNTSNHEQFVQEMIACQGTLYAYILSLTADADWADEALQQTNLVLLRKEQEFELGTNFKAWACGQAFFQVLSDRKAKKRSRLVFDDSVLSTLAPAFEKHAERHDDRRRALRVCLETLSTEQRELIQRRYAGESVGRLAKDSGRPEGSISQALYRIRQALKKCVQRKLAGVDSP